MNNGSISSQEWELVSSIQSLRETSDKQILQDLNQRLLDYLSLRKTPGVYIFEFGEEQKSNLNCLEVGSVRELRDELYESITQLKEQDRVVEFDEHGKVVRGKNPRDATRKQYWKNREQQYSRQPH